MNNNRKLGGAYQLSIAVRPGGQQAVRFVQGLSGAGRAGGNTQSAGKKKRKVPHVLMVRYANIEKSCVKTIAMTHPCRRTGQRSTQF